MNKIYRFKMKNQKKREEKLISELIGLLDETLMGFIKLNFDRNKPIDIEQFGILRDACMNFSASMIKDLAHILYPENRKELIQNCLEIFVAQIEEPHKDGR